MNCAIGVRILLIGVTAVVVAAVIAAIVVLGTPAQQRQRRLDERRVRDLSTIENSIGIYTNMHGALPSDLALLGKEPGSRSAPSDPDTGAAYEYTVIDTESYRLCAVFSAPSSKATSTFMDREEWTHGAGKQCFERRQKPAKK